MFTMTATKSSTCPLSGLTIEPGDTITRAGNKYTPWSLTNSEILRKRRIAAAYRVSVEHGAKVEVLENFNHGIETPSAPNICPICLNDVYPGDLYCGYCGVNLTDGYLDETHDERTAMPTTVTDAYTVATDDERPTVIAEVRHIEAPAPKALLGFSTPKRDVVIAEPTPEPIAPQNAPESRTDGPTPITADTITEQYAYISPKDFVSLMAGATKLVRDAVKEARADAKAEGTKYDSSNGLRESVRIITLPDGTIYAGQLMGDDAGQTTCTKGTGIDACFDQDQASALARYLIDTKSRIPRMVRLSIEGKYLVIEQESTVKGRWDKMRFAHQIEPTNTGQMSGWPARKQEQQAA